MSSWLDLNFSARRFSMNSKWISDAVSPRTSAEVLGLTASEIHFEFIENLRAEKLRSNHELIQKLFLGGKELKKFALELVHYLNALVFIREGVSDSNSLEISPFDFERLSGLREAFSRDELFLLGDLVFDLLRELKKSVDEKTLFDFFLIKLHRYKN